MRTTLKQIWWELNSQQTWLGLLFKQMQKAIILCLFSGWNNATVIYNKKDGKSSITIVKKKKMRQTWTAQKSLLKQ